MEGWFFVGYVMPRDYGLGSNQDPGSLVSPRRGDYYCCVEHTCTRVTSGSRVAWFSGCRVVASQGGKTPQWVARTALACLRAQYIASFSFSLFVGLSLLVRSHGRRLQEAWCHFPPGHEAKASGSLVARYMGVFYCIKHTQDRKVSRCPLQGCFSLCRTLRTSGSLVYCYRRISVIRYHSKITRPPYMRASGHIEIWSPRVAGGPIKRV